MTTSIKVKPVSGKSTTMYEVDENKTNHKKSFPDFIRSLGFDVVDKDHIDAFVIDGEQFNINYDKTSEEARNGWTRERSIRKDRCIEIIAGRNSIVAKVKFNEEIDRDKLVAKIQKSVNEKKAWRQERIDRKNNEMRLLTIMRDHYYASKIISAYVESIMVHEGFLNFCIYGATIKVDASIGVPKEFIPYERKDGIVKVGDITKWAYEKSDIASTANKVCSELEKLKAVGKEFSEFAKGSYYRYVRKNRIEEI